MTEENKAKSLHQILNKKPDFVNDTPLDRFFENLDSQLFSKINNESEEVLYKEVGCTGNAEFVKVLLQYLEHSNDLVITSAHEAKDHSLVPISLHDMKYFDLLVNMIVVHGVYAHLPPGFGIPLDQRMLENFRKRDKKFIVPRGCPASLDTLGQVASSFYRILTSEPLKQNTIGGLLLKGTGYTDLVTALIVLVHDKDREARFLAMYDLVEGLQETYELFSLYTLLVHSTSNPVLRDFVLQKLSTLPIRRTNGVISLVDFVIGVREDEEIDSSKFKRVTQILVSKPKTTTSIVYFTKLFDQIYDGLTFVNRPVLISCLNNVVTELYFKNKRIVHDFLFKRIAEVLYNECLQDYSSKTLNDTINVLISLSKNPSMEVTQDLTNFSSNNFYSTLWVYCMFLKKNQRLQPAPDSQGTAYYTVIIGLIKTFITVNSDHQSLREIVLNLVNYDHDTWGYGINMENQLPYIRVFDETNVSEELKNVSPATQDKRLKKVHELFLDIDCAVDLFMELLKALNEPEIVKELFLSVLNRWVTSTNKVTEFNPARIPGDVHASLLVLVDLKLLEKMDASFKNDIIKKPRDILILIEELLELKDQNDEVVENQPDSDDEDDFVDEKEDESNVAQEMASNSTYLTVLKLLSTILTSTSPRELSKSENVLNSISSTLSNSKEDPQARALVTRIRELLSTSKSPDSSQEGYAELDADNEALEKAIGNLNDTLVPIRAHGLYELRQLIERKSPVIDLKYVLDVHVRQLHDKEPFIYLNAIKGLSSLCEVEPDGTLDFLLNLYQNRESKYTLDDVLKTGEVLLNYVTTQNELFGGQYANTLVAICLDKVQQHEKLDNRIRMSAMSILGVCLQVNARGVQSQITDILDCSFGILKLEKNSAGDPSADSSKLLRRSAIHVLHALVSSSGLEMFPPQYAGHHLLNLLNYVKQTDDDYLVCEQAGDLLEAIKDCQLNRLDSSYADTRES